MTKKLSVKLAAAAVVVLASQQASAVELKSDGKDLGKADVQLKSVHVFGGRNNGYDPTTGTAYLAELKYETPSWNDFNLGLARVPHWAWRAVLQRSARRAAVEICAEI